MKAPPGGLPHDNEPGNGNTVPWPIDRRRRSCEQGHRQIPGRSNRHARSVQRTTGVWSGFVGNPCPWGTPCNVLVRATVQNPKRAGTEIFFIGVRTRTYGDFGGQRNSLFWPNPCNTAGNGGARIDRRSLKCEVRCLKQGTHRAKQSQFPRRAGAMDLEYTTVCRPHPTTVIAPNGIMFLAFK